MVKNTTGGNKQKSQARKLQAPSHSYKKVRVLEEDGEMYAQVSKLLGNGMCHVSTLDGTKMLCMIRGKFRGRNKRDNHLKTGTWILVATREWEEKKTDASSLNKCDLLEVYSDLDKEKLKSSVNIDWRPFVENDCLNQFSEKNDDDLFQFTSAEQEEYAALMKQQLTAPPVLKMPTLNESDPDPDPDEEINIDDI